MVGGLKSMSCEEQLNVYIKEHGHDYMITVVTFLEASHIKEKIKQWYSRYGQYFKGKYTLKAF